MSWPRQYTPHELCDELPGWLPLATPSGAPDTVVVAVSMISHEWRTGRGQHRTLIVRTPEQEIQIGVSPSGRSVRIFVDHVEIRPGLLGRIERTVAAAREVATVRSVTGTLRELLDAIAELCETR